MDYLNLLNQEQKEAVLHLDGPALVLAGAGSGKTRVVTMRIIHLIRSGIMPYQILGLTFTNKAAEEMKERVEQLTQSQGIWLSTFHSLGVRILRESISHLGYTRSFVIYDESDSEKLLAAILEQKGIKGKKGELKLFRNLISTVKNNLQDPEEVDVDSLPEAVSAFFPAVYKSYQEQLKACDAVDFDDLLLLPVKIFEQFPVALEYYQNKWKHLLIDEYQDTNAAQYALVKLLVQRSQNLFVVGDPDQAIYSWRGANIRNILQFESDYPGAKVIRLEQNYRSRTNILRAANALIRANKSRFEKELWSEKGEGAKLKRYTGFNERDEARFVANQIRSHRAKDGIPYKEMVVFYRTNAQSRPFEDQLLSVGIPYTIVGGISFYARKEIKDVIAYLRMIQSDSDQLAFMRASQVPKRGLGESSVEKLLFAAQQEKLPILLYLRKLLTGDDLEHKVTLSAKAKEGLKSFIFLIDDLRIKAQNEGVEKIVQSSIEDSGYLHYLKEDQETYQERYSNLTELIAKASEWDIQQEEENQPSSLNRFLEEISLKSSLDENLSSTDHVRLMTLHNGKGLEFMVAFVVGLEEDLLPHANSRESEESVEEERRLCYVGMTRAKEYLYLTDCQMRYLWGTQRFQRPSRFLKEIPRDFF